MQKRQTHSTQSPLKSLINTSWNLAVADGLTLISIAFFIIVLGRVYGSASLGKLSFALAVAAIAQTICIAGYDISLPRMVSKQPQNAASLCMSALRVELFLCVCVLPFCILSALMKDNETLLCTSILCVDVIPAALAFAFVSVLRGLHHAAEAARINAVFNIIPMLISTLLIFTQAPLWCFALWILSGDIAKLLWLRRRFSEHHGAAFALSDILIINRLFDREHLRTAWRDQRAISITNLCSALLVRMPSVMLGWFATDVQNGIYSAASRFFTALRIVPGAVMHTIIPRYASSENRLPRIRIVVALTVVCATALSAMLYFGAETIMHISFRFEESIPILQILSLAFAALFLKTTLEAFLLAAHREDFINRALITVSVVALLGYWIAAHNSPNQIAWVVTAAESVLALVFLGSFMVMRLRQPRTADVVITQGSSRE